VKLFYRKRFPATGLDGTGLNSGGNFGLNVFRSALQGNEFSTFMLLQIVPLA
jgi:hypothetical protein